MGYKLAIFPVTALLAATQAMQAVYGALAQQGFVRRLRQPLMPFTELTKLMGFPDVHAFERRWAEDTMKRAMDRTENKR